jgi:hypothetical protein
LLKPEYNLLADGQLELFPFESNERISQLTYAFKAEVWTAVLVLTNAGAVKAEAEAKKRADATAVNFMVEDTDICVIAEG